MLPVGPPKPGAFNVYTSALSALNHVPIAAAR